MQPQSRRAAEKTVLLLASVLLTFNFLHWREGFMRLLCEAVPVGTPCLQPDLFLREAQVFLKSRRARFQKRRSRNNVFGCGGAALCLCGCTVSVSHSTALRHSAAPPQRKTL